MNPSYFISDVHFGTDEDVRIQRDIRKFFDHVARRRGTLYIIGDYFDFWFEYRHAVPKACLTGYHELVRLREMGVALHYLLGNHDQWALDFFEKHLGAIVHRGPQRISVQEMEIYLHHGDGVSDRDRRYRIVKRAFHNAFNRWLYRWVHPDVGLPLGRKLSDHSKSKDREYDKYREDRSFDPWLQQLFSEGVDLVIMGHHHIPVQRAYGDHCYVNLGAWPRHKTYVEVSNGRFQLRTWNSEL